MLVAFLSWFSCGFSFPFPWLQTSLSKPHIDTWENHVCRILTCWLKLDMNEHQIGHVCYIQAKKPHRHIPSLTEGGQYPSSSQAYTHAHTAPLQSHPPLPCTYFPSPVVNRIPLDDITGNKGQQDNKRSELQSTSFISDFITPRLMDVDLSTLLHLSCSVPQTPPPPHSSSFFSHWLYFTLSVFSALFMIPWLTHHNE